MLLAFANIRKNKGQTLSFFIVIFLAAFLLNLGLLVWMNYDKNFDESAKELNAADSLIVVQNRDEALERHFSEKFENDKRVSAYEIRSVLFGSGEYQYGKGFSTRALVFMCADTMPNIGKFSFFEKENEGIENPIYLPRIFKMGGNYAIGDVFSITLFSRTGETQREYTVAGFFEDSLLGTINSSLTGILLEKEEFDALSEEFNDELDAVLFLAQLTDQSEAEIFTLEYSNDLKDTFTEEAMTESTFYQWVKQSRTITSSIGAQLIVSFSFIIVGISLIIVKFRIDNYIEEEMHNLGALKAIGYTGWQILFAILTQFLSVSFIGCFLGIALSYAFVPIVSDMFATQTGILWIQPFSISSTLLCLLIILSLVVIVSLLSAGKARKLSPIMALRSGIATHNFKRNFFPLEKMRGTVNQVLSLKSCVQNVRRSVMIGLIITVISFATAFACVSQYNFHANGGKEFLNIVSGENPDAGITVSLARYSEKMLLDVRAMPEVENAFFYQGEYVMYKEDGLELMCNVSQDFTNLENQSSVYSGRFPKFHNEIAINGLLARELNKKIGDSIVIAKGKYAEEYLITGLIQGANYLGKEICLTEDGFAKLESNFSLTSIYVYLYENEDINVFLTSVQDRFGERLSSTTNIGENIISMIGAYQDMVSILVMLIFLVTLVIVFMTLHLIIKTTLLHRQRDIGLMKALGYTTKQLVLQTSGSIFPVLLLGSVFGCILGYFGVNPLLSMALSSVGVMKVNFKILPELLLVANLGIVLFGFFISILVSMRIRKIAPVELMAE